MTKLDCGPFVPERIAEWAYWCKEREAMRVRKAANAPYPGGVYSKDPHMAGTRWCNFRRMDDKVSIWLMEDWYPDAATAEHWYEENPRLLMVSALLARMINRVETLTYITGGKRFSKWDYELFRKRMYEVKDSGQPVFTGVYIINGASGGPKIEQVLGAIDKCWKTKPFRMLDVESMRQTATNLHVLPGVGSFIGGQVVADLRWVLNEPTYWLDRMTWAPPGPGSSRGMKYLLGLSAANDMAGRGKDLTEKQFLTYLPKLIALTRVHPVVGPIVKERRLEAHDIQNSLCEVSKYIRVKNGGRGKNPYPPKAK